MIFRGRIVPPVVMNPSWVCECGWCERALILYCEPRSGDTVWCPHCSHTSEVNSVEVCDTLIRHHTAKLIEVR